MRRQDGEAGSPEGPFLPRALTALCSHARSVNSLLLGPGSLDTCQQRKQAAISEKMGRTQSPHGILETWWVVDSYWILLFAPGADDLCHTYLHSSGRRDQESSSCVAPNLPWARGPVGFKKALCSVSWHSTAQKEICTLSPSACQRHGCLEGRDPVTTALQEAGH